jgi:hypothetical protein
MAMSKHGNRDQHRAMAPGPSRRERLQTLLFTAASIGTTLLMLGVLAEGKLPKYQGE